MNTTSIVSGAAGRLLLTWLLSIVVLFAKAKADETPVKNTDSPIHLKSGGASPIARMGRRLPFPLPVSPRFPSRLTEVKRSSLLPKKGEDNPINPAGKAPEKLFPNIATRPLQLLPLSGNLSLLTANAKGSFDYDPIRFTMTASKDSVAVGEEFELTIKAELLDIPSNLMFFFEEQKSFSLKVIMPEGFVQTGGDYHDYISGKLTGASTTASYAIRGKYNETLTGNCFTLLRGGYNATKADLFTKKRTVCVKAAKANPAYQQYVRNARVALYSEAPTNKTCGDGINVQNFYVDNLCVNRNQVIPFRVNGGNTSGSSKKIYVYLCFNDDSSIYEHEETVPPGSFSFVINSTIPLAPNCYTTLNNFVHIHYATTRLSTACGGLKGYCASALVDLNLLSAFDLSPANSVTNVGGNVTLATSGCSEQFVSWRGPNNETINGESYLIVSKQVTGTYTYTATCSESGRNCQKTAQITFNAPSCSTPVNRPSFNSITVSSGQAVSLQATGCVAGESYVWSLPDGASFTGNPYPLTATSSASYSVVCTNSCGNGPVGTGTVTVTTCNTPAAPTITTSCSGNSLYLTATCQTGTAGWLGFAGSTITPTAVNVYTAFCTSGACQSTTTFTPAQLYCTNCSYQTPTFTNTPNCSNLTYTISAACSTNSTGHIYWNDQDKGSSFTTGALSNNQSYTYTARCVWNGTGDQCSDSDLAQGTFTVNCTPTDPCYQKPDDQQLLASSETICPGSPVNLSANNCQGTVTWSHGLGTQVSVSDFPVTTTTYSYTCTLSGGCRRIRQKTINVTTCNPCINASVPTPAISGAANGTTVQLNTAITFTSSCPTSYTTHWYNGTSCLNCNVAGSWPTRQYDFTGTGEVEVKAKCVDSNQCEGDPSNVIRVNVINNPCINKSLPAPQVQNISVRSGESYVLSPSCSSGTAQVFLSNQWTNAPYTLTNISVPVTYQARCAETVGSATCSGSVLSGSVTLRANQGLIVNPTPDQDLTVNTPVDFYVNAFTDPDGDEITYTITGLPSGLTVVGRNITGRPALPDRARVTITASDGHGSTESTSFYITISTGNCKVTNEVNPAVSLATASYNCQTGRFYFASTQTSGIVYSAVGITGATQTTGPFTPDGIPDRNYWTLVAWQNGNDNITACREFYVTCNAPAPPTLTINAPGQNTVCSGSSVGLTISGCNNGTPKWSAGAETHTGTVISLTGLQANVVIDAWCQSEFNVSSTHVTTTIYVTPKPAAPTLVNPSPAVCIGQSATLLVSGNSCVGGNLIWSTTENGRSITATPQAAGTYLYTVSCQNNQGCISDNAVVTLTVYPIPNAPTIITNLGARTAYCAGESFALTVPDDGDLVWDKPNFREPIRILNPGAGQHTYTVYQVVNGCASPTTTKTITVEALPVVTITPASPVVCPQQSIALTAAAPGTNTYQWLDGGPATARYTGITAAGTYQVRVTSPNNCQTTQSVVVASGALPVISATVNRIITCSQPEATITVTPAQGYIYTFAGPGGLMQSGTSSVMNTTVAGTYSITVLNSSGCFAVTTATVNADKAQPSASVTASPSPVITCANPQITLTAGGGNTGGPFGYTWSNGGNAATTSVNIAGTYSVTVSGTNGCTATTSIVISASTATPVLTVAASRTTLTCADPNAVLTFSGADSYTLIRPGGATDANVTSGLSVNVAGTYTLIGKNNATGCTRTEPVVITSNTTVSPITINTPESVVCTGETVTISVNTCAGTLTWETAGLTNVASRQVGAGVYSATCVHGVSGCSSVASTSITAAPVPQLVVNSPTICLDQTATLTVSGCNGGITWSTGGATPSVVVRPEVSGVVNYTAVCTEGSCATFIVAAVTVRPKPALTLTAGGMISCLNPSVALTAAGATSYTFTGPNAFYQAGSSPNAAVSQAGAYTVTGVSTHGCVNTVQTTVSGNTDRPVISLAAASQTICLGAAVQLQVTGCTSGNVSWSDGGTGATRTVTPTTAGVKTYTATCAPAAGAPSECASQTVATVVVNQVPGAAISGIATFCANGSTPLTAAGTTGQAVSGFRWDTGETGSTIEAAESRTYSVTVTATNGCWSTAQKAVSVLAGPAAGITAGQTVCAGQTVVLTASGGTSYQWNTGANTAAISVSPAVTTPYSVTISTNGCSAVLQTTVTVQAQIAAPAVTTQLAGTTNANSLTLTATGCPAGSTIRWTGPGLDGPGNTTATGATWVYALSQTSSFSVTCLATGGCQSPNTVLTVSPVNPQPPLISASGALVCAGQSITLTANGGCSVNGSGIRWSTGAETETIVVTPLTTTTYTAYCTAGQVISQSSNTVKVTVSNSVTISGQISYTAGQTILLTATASPSAGATYTWSGPQPDGAESYSSTGAVLQRIGATANYSGTYTVKATNNDGCLGQASVQVVVTPASCTGITAAISAPAAITAGQALTLTGSVTPANASATYRWSGPAGSGPAGFTSTASAPTIPAATTANSGVYSLTVTLPGGCTATANATVTVVPAATTSCAGTSVTVIAPASLTAGQTLTLSATVSPASTSATYTWTGPTGFTATTPVVAITATTTAHSGTYSLTVTLPNGCTATASASVTVVPAGTTACTGLSAFIAAPAGVTAGQPLSLTAIVSPGNAGMVYAWTGPTGFTATTPVAAIPATTTAHSGTYSLTVQVAGQSSCSATAATTITVVSNTDTLTTDCDIRIVSVDAAGQETVFIPRSVTGQNALTLSVENLGGTPLTGYTYRWTRTTGVQTASATSTTAGSGTATAPVTVTVGTTPTISATAIGEYMVVLTDAAGNTCVAYSTISAKPCNERTAAYSSCKDVTITNPDATNAISNLAPGDQFYAGDYKVTVTSITGGGPGGWTGEGIVDVTLLKGINLPAQVTFDNAKLNDCYELAAGKLVTKYDPSWSNILDVKAFLEDIQEALAQVNDLLGSYKGTPEQVQSIQTSLIPLLQPYAQEVPQAAALIQKLDALSKQCKTANGEELSETCKQKLAEVKTDYEALQEIVDGLPPIPIDLFAALNPASPNGRVAAGNAPDVTITELNLVASQGCTKPTGCTVTVRNIKGFWGQPYKQGYEFWLVESNGQKYWVYREYNLSQPIYGYLPYEDKSGRYTIFYPEQGQTAGGAFADAGQRFVKDAAVILVTGGASTFGEVVVSNFVDAFVTALDECNGDETAFYRILGENLLWCGFDVAEFAQPAFKKLFTYVGPNFAKFKADALLKLNTWKSTSNWLAEITEHLNKVPTSELNKYKKIAKGNLQNAFHYLSKSGATFNYKTKQIIDQGGKVLGSFKKNSVKFINNSIPTGWQKKETLYNIDYEEVVDGIAYKRHGDIEVYEGNCSFSVNPNGRLASSSCLQLKALKYADFSTWLNKMLVHTNLRDNIKNSSETRVLAEYYWKNKNKFKTGSGVIHKAFKAVDGSEINKFEDFFDRAVLNAPGSGFLEAHHILPYNVFQGNKKLQLLLFMATDTPHSFNFIGDDNGLMMLAVRDGIGHHSYAPRFDDQVTAGISSILGQLPDDSSTWSKLEIENSIQEIHKFVSCIKASIIRDCIEANTRLSNLQFSCP